MSIELAEQEDRPATAELVAPAQDPVTTALVEVTSTNAKMTELAARGQELATKYQGVVANVRTVKGYAEIAAIRTEMREEVRFKMQHLKAAGSKMLGTMREQFNARADELIAEAKGHETPFQELLDAEDKRKADEKAERDRLEKIRVDAHVAALAIITGVVNTATGKDAAEIQALIDSTEALTVDDGWEEFRGQAQQAKDEAVRQLNGMLVAALAEAAERAELEAERQRQAAFREQQEAQQRQLEEQQAELRRGQEALAAQQRELAEQQEAQARAVRERAEAVQSRIGGFALVVAVNDASRNSDGIMAAIEAAQNVPITAELFDARTGEAQIAKDEALNTLRGFLAAAEMHEAEEARQARAAVVQDRIDGIATAGAPLEGRSAEQLRSILGTLHTLVLTEELLDDRVAESVEWQERRVKDVEHELTIAVEREQRDAKEAEHNHKEIEANAAAVARITRMQDAAPRMLELLQELAGIDLIDLDVVTMRPLQERAERIVSEIEGEKNV